jgi:hypothetical protein
LRTLSRERRDRWSSQDSNKGSEPARDLIAGVRGIPTSVSEPVTVSVGSQLPIEILMTFALNSGTRLHS